MSYLVRPLYLSILLMMSNSSYACLYSEVSALNKNYSPAIDKVSNTPSAFDVVFVGN